MVGANPQISWALLSFSRSLQIRTCAAALLPCRRLSVLTTRCALLRQCFHFPPSSLEKFQMLNVNQSITLEFTQHTPQESNRMAANHPRVVVVAFLCTVLGAALLAVHTTV